MMIQKIMFVSAAILLAGAGCASKSELAAVEAERARMMAETDRIAAEGAVPRTPTSRREISFAAPAGWAPVVNDADVDKTIVFDVASADKSAEFMVRTDPPSFDGLAYTESGTENYVSAAASGVTYTLRTFKKNDAVWKQTGYKGYNDNPNMLPMNFVGRDAAGGFELRGVLYYDSSAVKNPGALMKLLLDAVMLK